MIKRLEADGFSLLRDVSLDFDPGFSVITGESGAGKTLVFDAIAFALGTRPSRGLLAQGSRHCHVKVQLEIPESIAGRIGSPWVPGANQIERRLSHAGKSSSYVNGERLKSQDVTEAAQGLVEITSQFDSRILFNAEAHGSILDRFHSAIQPLLNRYQVRFRELSDARNRLRIAVESEGNREHEIDLLAYQVDELGRAAVEPGEKESLGARVKLAENSRDIAVAADLASKLLSGTEEGEGAYDLAARAANEISRIGELAGQLEIGGVLMEDLDEKAVEIMELLQELGGNCSHISNHVQEDPLDLESMSARMDEILRLERKYNCQADELSGLLAEKQGRLEFLEGGSCSPDAIRKEVSELEQDTGKLARELTKLRKEAAKTLVKSAGDYFSRLDFSHVELVVDIEPRPDFSDSGRDSIELMISLNPGEPARALQQVASGGEAARLLLGLKAALAERMDFKTLLLDEIEAGLGGKAAERLSDVLEDIARGRQVIAITHLPVVASRGGKHLVATKSVSGGVTRVDFGVVEGSHRMQEISRMLGDTRGREEQALASRLLDKSGTG